MHVFLAMSERLLTNIQQNKKSERKFSFHLFFKHKT